MQIHQKPAQNLAGIRKRIWKTCVGTVGISKRINCKFQTLLAYLRFNNTLPISKIDLLSEYRPSIRGGRDRELLSSRPEIRNFSICLLIPPFDGNC